MDVPNSSTDTSPTRLRFAFERSDENILKLLLGGCGVKEGVGLTDYGILVIDTDGTVKKNDTLKSSPLGDDFENNWVIGIHSLYYIAASPEFEAYHRAQRPTSAACRVCPVLKGCAGGGMSTHRFKRGFRPV